MIAVKTALQRLAETQRGNIVPEIEELTREEIAKHGAEVFEPSGAGGRAFAEADRERQSTA